MQTTLAMRLTSLLGLFCMLALAWALSENRRKVDFRLILWGLGLQLFFALLVFETDIGEKFFDWVKVGFVVVTDASTEGARFLFGNLTQVFVLSEDAVLGDEGPLLINAIVAFQVLPVIIFVSALAGVLYHLRIIQALVKCMAWLMQKTLKTSGAETFGSALLVFAGIESMTALRGYLKTMTRSELCTLMTTFMATVAASVMVAYANFGAEPGHLLAASIMSAPAAILISKLMVPETEEPQTKGTVHIKVPVESHNVVDAAARGASEGLMLALHVGAMLIAFIGIVYLLNLVCQGIVNHSFTEIMGWFFRPFAYLLGVPREDVAAISGLLGEKTVLNEFLAFGHLQELIAKGELSERSVTIATYALCGFANPGSLGILIGGMSGLAPERRSEIAALGLKSLIGGTLACFTTACMAGILS